MFRARRVRQVERVENLFVDADQLDQAIRAAIEERRIANAIPDYQLPICRPFPATETDPYELDDWRLSTSTEDSQPEEVPMDCCSYQRSLARRLLDAVYSGQVWWGLCWSSLETVKTIVAKALRQHADSAIEHQVCRHSFLFSSYSLLSR